MNLRALQWIALAALVAAVGVLYFSNRRITAGVAAVRSENQELRSARVMVEQTAATKAQRDEQELARLRNETEDLERVREEAQQLRTAKQQLGQQVEMVRAQAREASGQVQSAQIEIQALRAKATQAAQEAQAAQAALATQRAAQSKTPGAAGASENQRMDSVAAISACIKNLRRIDAAKLQWAMENLNASAIVPAMADLAPYLQNDMPVCPAGGVYTVNAVGTAPTCSQPGHLLPK